MNAVTRRGLLTAGLGASAVVFGGHAAYASAGEAGWQTGYPGRRLRAMTFNIHHGEGVDGALDLHRVARVIERANPDVVGLQEVDRHWGERSDWVDQPRWLAHRLGMHYAFGANLDEDPEEPGAPRRQYGTAVLSRARILSWRNDPLPRFDGSEQRGLLQAETAAGLFCTTHLQHDDSAERVEQARAVVELLAGRAPAVVTGDLNAVPDTPELDVLTEAYADSWPLVGEGDGFTYPAEAPDRRIDYVLASRELRVVNGRVVDTDASDHLPYVAQYLRDPR